MDSSRIDRLVRVFAGPRSRRQAILAAGAIFIGAQQESTAARRQKTDRFQRGSRSSTAFSKKCRRFIIAAGPNRDDRFEHTDDDLLIEVIPKKGGSAKVVFDDNNNAPNGDNGDHLRVNPFAARVGDEIHIVARNEVAGGCELDETWLHCIEGKGGKVKLTDRILPENCQSDANRVGVFLDTTVRITNK